VFPVTYLVLARMTDWLEIGHKLLTWNKRHLLEARPSRKC
jgi:hypothetical protein